MMRETAAKARAEGNEEAAKAAEDTAKLAAQLGDDAADLATSWTTATWKSKPTRTKILEQFFQKFPPKKIRKIFVRFVRVFIRPFNNSCKKAFMSTRSIWCKNRQNPSCPRKFSVVLNIFGCFGMFWNTLERFGTF